MKISRPQLRVLIITSPSAVQQRCTELVVLGLKRKVWVSGAAKGDRFISPISPGSKARAARLSPWYSAAPRVDLQGEACICSHEEHSYRAASQLAHPACLKQALQESELIHSVVHWGQLEVMDGDVGVRVVQRLQQLESLLSLIM